jgi:hypothetical protein
MSGRLKRDKSLPQSLSRHFSTVPELVHFLRFIRPDYWQPRMLPLKESENLSSPPNRADFEKNSEQSSKSVDWCIHPAYL